MSGPPTAVAEVRRAVRRALSDLVGVGAEVRVGAGAEVGVGAVAAGPLVLVACSGGADSLALAAATAFEAPRLGLRVGAVVVDHGWHDDSAQVAGAAAAACTTLGLTPVVVARTEPDGQGGGPEATARRGRHRVLRQCAEQYGAVAVLLGHTLDDQAETVLLGLARGSGARSTAGMSPVAGLLRRPLLGLPRASTLEFCRLSGLQPWHDPANDDDAYTRSRLRRVLASLGEALGPGLAANLARSAELAREDADALDGLAAEALRRLELRSPDCAELDCAELAALVPAVRRRVVLRALREVGCPASALGRRHVLAVDALVTAWHGQGPVHLPAGVVARRRCGTLVLHRAAASAGRTDHDSQE